MVAWHIFAKIYLFFWKFILRKINNTAKRGLKYHVSVNLPSHGPFGSGWNKYVCGCIKCGNGVMYVSIACRF